MESRLGSGAPWGCSVLQGLLATWGLTDLSSWASHQQDLSTGEVADPSALRSLCQTAPVNTVVHLDLDEHVWMAVWVQGL